MSTLAQEPDGADLRRQLEELEDRRATLLGQIRDIESRGLGVIDPDLLDMAAMLRQSYKKVPKDPVLWVQAVFPRRHLWSKQCEIMESVRDNRKTAVKACHGVGKSFVSALIACWWVSIHPPAETLVVTTAPTAAQVNEILWQEIKKAHEEGNLAGTIDGNSVWKNGISTIGMGRKPADHNESAFQGLHRKYLLAIMDEAGGVQKQFWTAFDAVTTGKYNRQLVIGNPDDPSSEFAKACADPDWNVIRISAFDSPNLTGEEVPEAVAENLVARPWVESAEKRWGKDSPLYWSKVLGLFPEIGDDVLIPPAWINAAQRLDLLNTEDGKITPRQLGPPRVAVDVARFGKDETTIGVRHGGRFRIVKTIQASDLNEVTGNALLVCRDNRGSDVVIDGAGLGAGVVDRMKEVVSEEWSTGSDGNRPKIVEFNGANKTTDPKKFLNCRAEWYWKLREMFQAGEIDIDPEDDRLVSQLSSIKYKVNSKGQIFIESKADLKARGMPSPDRADTLVMSLFGRGGTSTKNVTLSAMGRQVVTGQYRIGR